MILNITPQYIESYCSSENKDQTIFIRFPLFFQTSKKKEIILEKDKIARAFL